MTALVEVLIGDWYAQKRIFLRIMDGTCLFRIPVIRRA